MKLKEGLELIDEFLDLIYWHAHRFLRQDPGLWEFEDLVQEGICVLLKCRKVYKPKGATFKSFFTTCLVRELRNLCWGPSEESLDQLDRLDEFLSDKQQEDLDSLIQSICENLRGDLLFLFKAMTSERLVEVANRNHERKKQLKHQGKNVRGYRKTLVLGKHLSEITGFSLSKITRLKKKLKREILERALRE